MPDITFKSREHKQRLVAIMEDIGKIDAGFGHSFTGKFDPEYASALYILTADLGTWKKAQGYVSQVAINFEEMLKEVDFSSGYSVLIRLAGNLFSGEGHADPVEIATGLDENNFDLALNAIKIRRYGLRIDKAPISDE